MADRAMRRRGLHDVAPAIERLVRPVVSGFQLFRRQPGRLVDDVTRVVEIPVVGDQPMLRGHARMERSPRVRRQDVEGRGRDAALDCPIDGTREDVAVFSVEPEDEAAVDHHAQVVEPADHALVVASEILPFVGVLEAAR